MVNGVGAFINNSKEIVISDYKHNFPRRITITYLANEKVKISLYRDQGKEEHVLCICDDVPKAVKEFKLASGSLFSGLMINEKPMPNSYAQLSYKNHYGA